MIRCDGNFGEVDKTSVPVSFLQIAKHLIVRAILFNDVDDVLERRVATHRATLVPVVSTCNTLSERRQLGESCGCGKQSQAAIQLSKRVRTWLPQRPSGERAGAR